MGQAWRDGLEANFCETEVRAGWREGAILIWARLKDECLFTKATENNQDLWALGDVFEIFLKDAEKEEYFEFHITPRSHRLQLRFPNGNSVNKIRAGQDKLSDYAVDEPIFDFKVRETLVGWEVYAELPNSLFGWDKTGGRALLCSFSRYDYDDAGGAPILSSTSEHKVLNYHRQEEWRRLVTSP